MRFSYPKRILLTMIIMLATSMLVMAALWMPPIKRHVKIMDAMFVIDITDSMNVVDAGLNGNPVSRETWARDFVRRTLLKMPCGSHAGLAVFTQSRSLILINPVEVCSSYHALNQILNQVTPYMAWQRSSQVSRGVYSAIRQAKDIEPQPSIVFITDGHEASPLDEGLLPRFDGKPGQVKGLLVGVGGDKLLPIPKTNDKGKIEGFWGANEVVQTKQHTEQLSSQKRAHLRNLAERVGFDYVSSPIQPSKLLDTLSKQAKTRPQVIDYDLYSWFAGLAMVLFLLVYLPYGRLMRLHN